MLAPTGRHAAARAGRHHARSQIRAVGASVRQCLRSGRGATRIPGLAAGVGGRPTRTRRGCGGRPSIEIASLYQPNSSIAIILRSSGTLAKAHSLGSKSPEGPIWKPPLTLPTSLSDGPVILTSSSCGNGLSCGSTSTWSARKTANGAGNSGRQSLDRAETVPPVERRSHAQLRPIRARPGKGSFRRDWRTGEPAT
jgi:hypothetical protein